MSAVSSVVRPGTPTAAQLLAAARALAPEARAQIPATDAERRLDDAFVKRMFEHGLLGLMTPRRYGGTQSSLQTYAAVMDELGQADGSTAWIACLNNVCNYITAMLFSEAAHTEVFTRAGGALIAGVLAPRLCKARKVPGGVVIDEGKWSFNSGVWHADWDLLAIPTLDDNGNTIGQSLALLPIKDVEILDEWHTIGMRGTGSTTVVVRDVFVPDVRLGSMSDAVAGGNGSPHLRGEALYRTAFVPVLAIVLAYPALGMARGALNEFLATIKNRTIPYTFYSKATDAAVTHVAAAEASAKIRCAALLIEHANAEIEACAEHGAEMPLEQRARIRLDTGYSARLCYEAVDTLAAATGGSFATESNLLNRYWRDLRTVSLHAIANPTTNLELYGRVLCGLEPNTPVV